MDSLQAQCLSLLTQAPIHLHSTSLLLDQTLLQTSIAHNCFVWLCHNFFSQVGCGERERSKSKSRNLGWEYRRYPIMVWKGKELMIENPGWSKERFLRFEMGKIRLIAPIRENYSLGGHRYGGLAILIPSWRHHPHVSHKLSGVPETLWALWQETNTSVKNFVI